MRRDDLQTLNTASALFVMLLTVGTIAPHTYDTAIRSSGLERTSTEAWTARQAGLRVARSSERRAPAAAQRESGDALRRGDRARKEALMLLVLIGQGARAQIGLAR